MEMKVAQTMRDRYVGCYASRGGRSQGVRISGCADARTRFPGEAIREAPVTVGEARKQQQISRYLGIWTAKLWPPQTTRDQTIGCYAYATEESGRSQGVRLSSCAGARGQVPRAKAGLSASRLLHLTGSSLRGYWRAKGVHRIALLPETTLIGTCDQPVRPVTTGQTRWPRNTTGAHYCDRRCAVNSL